jgi:hypothetical protein
MGMVEQEQGRLFAVLAGVEAKLPYWQQVAEGAPHFAAALGSLHEQVMTLDPA